MSKKISKDDLSLLINRSTLEILEKNKDLVDNDLKHTINISILLSSITTVKVLKELDLIDLEIE